MGLGERLIVLVVMSCVCFAPSRTTMAKQGSTSIAPLTKRGLPNVQSAAVVVTDAKTGKVVFSKNPNTIRSIASTTKIFVAILVRRRKIDLDASTKMTKTDANYAKGGARTRLEVGRRFRNQDLLRAMLIASDNRAPTALGRAVGLSPKALIRELNKLAKQLGLKKTTFTDPSGLRGNTSTAREMARALAVAMQDPYLAKIMSTKDTTVYDTAKRPTPIYYRNTNRSLHSGTYKVLGGKTGYTDAAGYCLLIDAKIKGRRLHMAFLGAGQKLTRFGDFGRVAKWYTNKK